MFAGSVVVTRLRCEHSGRPGNVPCHVREGERGAGVGWLGTRCSSTGSWMLIGAT
jgi:hypothetical protein